ncbi:HNH endonuclease [Zavarzinella formosa]|uniref:HNH endonuclease n=1 Tax=Zavarzinella formosa TaxID=360055 RepID=UPI00031EF2A9|nr:HNH endonuclease signature motif containing protein [Zavarzinella formosa]
MPYAPKPLPRSRLHRPDNRPTRQKRGYDRDWEKLRAAVIDDEPLCRMCMNRGRHVAADLVDHIQPIEDGGERLSRENLQPLCRKCHGEKTAEDLRKRRGKA